MSLQSFLSKIWNEIKLFFDQIPTELKTAIHIGVVVTENIKNFVDSPQADILTALIPGDVDDKIKDLLRAKLPVILTELKLVDSSINLNYPAEITASAVKILQDLDGDVKSGFLHNLSIIIAKAAADNKLTWSEGVYILEWYYEHKYKNAA